MPSSAAPVLAMASVDQGGDLVGGQLLRQVVGQHRRLGPLLLGELGPIGVRERLLGLATLLGLLDHHVEDLLLGQLVRLTYRTPRPR